MLDGSQRERILGAVVEVVAERGYARASVGGVVGRARVSRATFYKLFPGGVEDGVVAVMDMGLERVGLLASQALEREGSWRDGLRGALAAVLAFFDREPELARVLVVESLAAGGRVREHRERTVRAFRRLVVAGIDGELGHASPLAAQGVLASVMEIVRARLIAPERQPLVGLVGPLMGLIVGPLTGWETAAEESRRGEELARAIQAGEVSWALPPKAPTPHEATLPAIFVNPNARRARECLLFLAGHPDSSNREVAVGVGVAHLSQVSRLLARLAHEKLAVKRCEGAGRRNAWRLTPRGKKIARTLQQQQAPAAADLSSRDAYPR